MRKAKQSANEKPAPKPKKKTEKITEKIPKESAKLLTELLKNTRNDFMRFNPKRKTFCISEKGKEIILKGLRPSLRSVFWPDYVYQEGKYHKGTGVSNLWEGLARGKYVHTQMEDYINMEVKDFLKKHSSLNPYTKKVIQALREWKMIPCRAEFPLYDLQCRVGTQIDAILVDEHGEFAIMDWKCGMDDYIMRGSGMMKGPFTENYSNCPLHQSYLQVLFEKVMIEKFYNFKVKNLYVVQIEQMGVKAYPVPAPFVEKATELYEYFCRELEKQKNDRISKALAKRRRRKIPKKTLRRALPKRIASYKATGVRRKKKAT